MPDPNPERRLPECIACLASADGNRVLGRWSERDWLLCVGQAERHGLTAYLNRRLKETRPAVAVPAPVQDRLHQTLLSDASRTVRLFHGISGTLRVLKAAGVRFIVLKGAYLAEAVYGEITLRPMGDLDLLLRPDAIPDASELLLGSGFRPMNPSVSSWREWTADEKKGFLRGAKHFFDLVHPGWRLKVDLHASLVRASDPFTIDAGALWGRAVPARIADEDALVLSPVDALLHLCLHASVAHRFRFGLRPMVDLFEILRRHADTLSWLEVTDRAREWGAERSVWLSLSLCRELLSARVPDAVLNALEPRVPHPEYRDLAVRNILQPGPAPQVLPDDFIRSWSAERFRDRASALARALFPPARVMALMYPASPDSWRIILYYPVRWRDVFSRWGRTCWNLLTRKKEASERLREEKKEVAFTDWLRTRELPR